jgi:hypothetical protein
VTRAALKAAAGPAPGALAELGLRPADLDALAKRGFVAADSRPSRAGPPRGPYYKLRWREGGRQRVRYLGTDPARAEAVRDALAELHRPARLARGLARLLAEARQRLRRVRRALQPHLAARGLRLHGYAARRASARRDGRGAARTRIKSITR